MRDRDRGDVQANRVNRR